MRKLRRKNVPPERQPYFDEAMNCYRVPLTNGRTATIDAEDVERVSQFLWRWRPHKSLANGQAEHRLYVSRTEYTNVRLSRFILGVSDDVRFINHINDDSLDYRKANLRTFTREESSRHFKKMKKNRFGDTPSSRFKGVSRFQDTGKWIAQIRKDGVNYYLGLFTDEEAAARAYDASALEKFGHAARINFAIPLTQEAA
ncbi:MAG TPA: AP2 domain-containing protein [Tepidisphaeraceae bacterium]|jgi:hypothetical protein|nr:AP2 domain-containing protein [Tepidisphaeraceae bacterium]